MVRPTIFELAGGDEAFLALAAAMHERCLEDPVLNHIFSQPMSPDHVRNLATYWAEVFGGLPRYSSEHGGHSAMLAIHKADGASDDLGDRFVACFVQAMDDARLPDDEELRNTLRAYMEWATQQVLATMPTAVEVPSGLRMPRWSWNGLVRDPSLDDA